MSSPSSGSGAAPIAVRSVCFNQSQDLFAIATDDGVRIFDVQNKSMREIRYLTQEQVGSVRLAVIMYRSNIIALVAGGSRPRFAPNTVMIWDDKSEEFIMEVAVPGGPVLNVLMNLSRLIIVQARRIHVYALLPTVKFLRSEETRSNPLGIAALGGDGPSAMLAVPFFKLGSVQLITVENMNENKSLAPNTVEAHRGEVTQLAINAQGTLLATGSSKGTVIRVFDTRTRIQLSELRRGTDPCTLHCLSFSHCASFLAVTSDKGTVHIFSVRENGETGQGWLHRKNIFDDTRRSMAQFSLSEDVITRCAFITEPSGDCKSVMAVCSDGSFHRFSFNKEGLCERSGHDKLLELGSDIGFYTGSV